MDESKCGIGGEVGVAFAGARGDRAKLASVGAGFAVGGRGGEFEQKEISDARVFVNPSGGGATDGVFTIVLVGGAGIAVVRWAIGELLIFSLDRQGWLSYNQNNFRRT
jgi:hypothetical protein